MPPEPPTPFPTAFPTEVNIGPVERTFFGFDCEGVVCLDWASINTSLSNKGPWMQFFNLEEINIGMYGRLLSSYDRREGGEE
jgi:hypothetical protein